MNSTTTRPAKASAAQTLEAARAEVRNEARVTAVQSWELAAFIGTRATLEAQPDIPWPAEVRWPEILAGDFEWTAGGLIYTLQRWHPDGKRMSVRNWRAMNPDWWRVRIRPTKQRRLDAEFVLWQRHKRELDAMAYRLTQKGWAEYNAERRRYTAAAIDLEFREFKTKLGLSRRMAY